MKYSNLSLAIIAALAISACGGSSSEGTNPADNKHNHSGSTNITDNNKPEGNKPESGKPEGGKPEGGKPEGGKPEGGKPEGGKPEGGKPEGGKPEDGKPALSDEEFEELKRYFSEKNVIGITSSSVDGKYTNQKATTLSKPMAEIEESNANLTDLYTYAYDKKHDEDKFKSFIGNSEKYGQYTTVGKEVKDENKKKHTIRQNFFNTKFSYSRFGTTEFIDHVLGEPDDKTRSKYYSYGDVTPLTQEVGNVLTGTAEYEGVGYLRTIGNKEVNFLVDFGAKADFTKKELIGTFSHFKPYDSKALSKTAYNDQDFQKAVEDLAKVNDFDTSNVAEEVKGFTAVIKGNTFADKKKTVTGRFYGPNGQEVGGVIKNEHIVGSFGGKDESRDK